LMPMLLLSNPHGREWRGVIEPPDWAKWWHDYREFITYFADIAREGEAAALMVGSELVSTESATVEWVKTIEAVRARFPGELGYSANWDTYQVIQFWDKLEIAGMTTYFDLSDHENPTVAELVQRWKPIYRDITAWQRRIDKPVVFTEVGWCSQSGASVQPWNYYRSEKATPEGHEEQRRLYEAFLTVWEGAPEVGGIIWWEWNTSPGGDDDYGYTPKGKPAEAVLRDWFTRANHPPTSQNTVPMQVEPDPNDSDGGY
ncbi:MAG: hypothetical protein JXO22_14480, partial [Phycisphaerae bacterium]|nr:hypothetical protein [Phycisphaerae bacterium]